MPLINFLEELPHITVKPQQHTYDVFLYIHPVTLGEVRTLTSQGTHLTEYPD
ncbi:hypothetical protein HMPREF0734_00505 [Rothia dentocariosa M567]|nr:hypothetical protein HMPREF0734_00505 [Rothia dentocariosa M567]